MKRVELNSMVWQRLPLGEQGKWQPWGLSILLHMGLALSLVVFWMSGQEAANVEARKGEIVLTIVSNDTLTTNYLTLAESVPSPRVEEMERFPNALSSSVASVESALDNERPPAIAVGELSEMEASRGDLGLPLPGLANPNETLRWGKGSLSFESNGRSTEDQKRLEEEQAYVASRQPIGEPISISVFGSGTLTGRSFVFLIDQSDSMGSGGLGVLEACITELSREIEKLAEYHQFQIVTYNDRTTAMGRKNLLPATPDHKRQVEPFLGNLVAVGGTNHEGGLMVGLSYEPDIVVLISDGGEPDLSDKRLESIGRLVPSKTQIHCLQFGVGQLTNETNSFMKRLATQNRGSYRYIDVSKWKKN
jgi:hypothetical protein